MMGIVDAPETNLVKALLPQISNGKRACDRFTRIPVSLSSQNSLYTGLGLGIAGHFQVSHAPHC